MPDGILVMLGNKRKEYESSADKLMSKAKEEVEKKLNLNGMSPNQLYKKYVSWAQAHGLSAPPKNPSDYKEGVHGMSFSQFMDHAKNEKLFNADGKFKYAMDAAGTQGKDSTAKAASDDKSAGASKTVMQKIKDNQGKIIAGIIILGALFMFYRANKKKA